MALADELLQAAKEFDPSLGLTYNKYYIGISKEGQPYNFSVFRPRKQHMILDLKLQKVRGRRLKDRSRWPGRS